MRSETTVSEMKEARPDRSEITSAGSVSTMFAGRPDLPYGDPQMSGHLRRLVRPDQVIELAARQVRRHVNTEWLQTNRCQGAASIGFSRVHGPE